MKRRVVIVAEKPKAAEKIANALGAKKRKKYNVPYWEAINGQHLIVVPAAGHLFGLTTSSNSFPIFTYEWKPLHEIDKSAKHTKKFLMLIASLSKGADLYVNACDYDIEGSVIGYMIIKEFGDLRKAKRMIFHALTPGEIRRAWKNLRPLDWEMINAGLARHELDWLWGINVSRALMRAYKSATGKRRSLSAGRVQSPTLNEIAKREIQIMTFVPIPYFVVSVKVGDLVLEPTLQFERKNEAEMWAASCEGFVERVEVIEERMSPPHPFNLPDLQMEAARLYGYSPAKTQSIAEDLYLDAYISYPRTNSQKYPKDLDYAGILRGLSYSSYGGLVRALIKEIKGVFKPNNGPKDDPAHPAMYPTGKVPKALDKDHARIYDLIVRRFLATLASPARYEVTKIYFKINDRTFKAVGRKVKWKGWTLYYPYSAPSEKDVPAFREGEEVKAKCGVRLQYTKPPERYTKAKIVKWMEKVKIGTEATRARIVETLFKRGYLKSIGGKVYVTELGLGVAEVLNDYFPEIVSIELTRRFEEEMDKIMRGERKKEEVVSEAKALLKALLAKYRPHLEEVGKKLAVALGDLEPQKKCKLCNREAEEGEFCRIHAAAREAVISAYPEWKRRLGISFKEYIMKLSKMRGVGLAVKDMAKVL